MSNIVSVSNIETLSFLQLTKFFWGSLGAGADSTRSSLIESQSAAWRGEASNVFTDVSQLDFDLFLITTCSLSRLFVDFAQIYEVESNSLIRLKGTASLLSESPSASLLTRGLVSLESNTVSLVE